MKFQNTKIAKIGQWELRDMETALWIFEHLDEDVIKRIEDTQTYFWVFAEIFRECLRYEDSFSEEVEKRLLDYNYMMAKKTEYERTHG